MTRLVSQRDITSIFKNVQYFPSGNSSRSKTKRLQFLRNIINEFLKPAATIPEEIKEEIVNKYEALLVQSIIENQPIGTILKKMMKEFEGEIKRYLEKLYEYLYFLGRYINQNLRVYEEEICVN